jgi:hypothetical protein
MKRTDVINALIQKYGYKSYLEVGVRDGDSFYQVVKTLPLDCVAVAVDFPGHVWGR